MEFEFIKQKNNSIIIYNLSGKLLETSDIESIAIDAKKEITLGNNKLVLNLENLIFLNSSGLNSFITILTKSRNNGGETVLCNLTDNIKKLFLITKLNTVFTLFTNQNDAVKYLNKNL